MLTYSNMNFLRTPVRTRAWLVASAMILTTVLTFPRALHADCSSSLEPLLWMWPSDGGSAPEDGVLWFVSGLAVGPIEIRIDGEVVAMPASYGEPVSLSHLGVGEHSWVVEGTGHDGVLVDSGTLEIVAGTGGLRGTASAPVLTAEEAFSAAWCGGVLNGFDCYDTGQDTYAVLTATAPGDVVGWLIHERYMTQGEEPEQRTRTELAPADCGSPRVFRHASGQFGGSDLDQRCYALTPLYPNGAGERGPETCFDEHAEPGGTGDGEPDGAEDTGRDAAVDAGSDVEPDAETSAADVGAALVDEGSGCVIADNRRFPLGSVGAVLALLGLVRAGRAPRKP